MSLSAFNRNRIREVNNKPYQLKGKYILYWMQAARRLDHNHALDYAIELSRELKKELIVYEGLRSGYKWNSRRIHKFILEGMCDNKKEAEKIGLNYWCYVETPKTAERGLLKKISENAAAIITDDFPCFIIPEQTEALGRKIECKLIAIDNNSITPISLYGEPASAARILRPRIHKLFAESYIHRAHEKIKKKYLFPAEKKTRAPFKEFSCEKKDIEKVLSDIQFQNDVPENKMITGGSAEAKKLLKLFVEKNLNRYIERSNPHSPELTPVSFLSPYLHFGHISAEEILTECLNADRKDTWAPDLLNLNERNNKDKFFGDNESLGSFFDELLTWRDIGYQFFWKKKEFNKTPADLPNWVQINLDRHRKDKREYTYQKEQFENAKTHDEIWNAAQKELVHTGRMHNYMRMLWGKKVIEWSKSYEEAFTILEDLNNKYAYDGRDPNSYTGILWCFGLFDRPWFPERNVFGTIRYMSSDSTRKKFKIKEYLDYVEEISGGQGLLLK